MLCFFFFGKRDALFCTMRYSYKTSTYEITSLRNFCSNSNQVYYIRILIQQELIVLGLDRRFRRLNPVQTKSGPLRSISGSSEKPIKRTNSTWKVWQYAMEQHMRGKVISLDAVPIVSVLQQLLYIKHG